MRAAYNMGSNTGTGQTVGLAEFAGYAASDVSLYFANIHQTNNVPIDNIVVDGGSATTWNNANDEGEVCLDIEQAVSVAPGLSQLRVYIGPESFGTGVDGFIFNQMATDNVAKQLSNSWWWSPDDPATDDPYFEEMATQGQTFFTISGDYGAYTGNHLQDMGYPAEDVHATVVGGTELTTVSAGGAWQSEVVWNDFGEGSGGGPADDGATYFSIPSWQSPVINSSNGGSTSLRNSPDVALQADFVNYICYNNGNCAQDWGGTSFATPRWAAWLALVNQQAVANGQPSGLGFINPTLYTIGQSSSYNDDFYDITSGNNDTQGQAKFYNAVTGYDLTTGWGSMNGQFLMADLVGTTEFSVSASTPSPATITAGQSTTSNIAVMTLVGFNDSVSLTCSVSPSPKLAPQCGVAPSSVLPGNSATLTVTTTPSTTAVLRPLGQAWMFCAFSLPLIGVTLLKMKFGSSRATSRTLLVLPLAALLISGFVFQTACGGSGRGSQGGGNGTPAGKYTVTITGTSGVLHQTTNVSFTVQ